MPRTAVPKPEQVPADSKPPLDMFTTSNGFTPNMLATFELSPIAFNSWATLLGSLSKALDVKTRDSIGLAVSEVKRDAAVQFARKVSETRGKVSDADLKAVRDAGHTDANVMEIVALVAQYSLTNSLNNVCSIPRRTFPALRRLARSSVNARRPSGRRFWNAIAGAMGATAKTKSLKVETPCARQLKSDRSHRPSPRVLGGFL